MNYFYKISLLFALCSLFLISCGSDGNCQQNSVVSLGVDFYKTELDPVTEQFKDIPYSDTLTIFGLGNDSLLANQEITGGKRLPLKNFSTQTTYIFERKNMQPDTITFTYENEENFISLECGCVIYHRITDVEYTFYSIDSVVVMNNFVADNKGKNIRIYFKNR